jgi:hypothetical protein
MAIASRLEDLALLIALLGQTKPTGHSPVWVLLIKSTARDYQWIAVTLGTIRSTMSFDSDTVFTTKHA